jgi:hypothetical protein
MKVKDNKKGAIEFSFAWIFAIVAGVLILVLTIYGIVKFMEFQRTQTTTENAMTLGVLTNPLESSFETEKRGLIATPTEMRIYTDCSNFTLFGKQTIQTSEEIQDKWKEGIEIPFQNKYIFSENPVEGRNFYLFSKPFEMPFKVADLIYLTSTRDKYCFVNPPNDIEDQIQNLIGEQDPEEENPNENFLLENRERDCPEESKKICFNGENCDISVSTRYKYVEKENRRMFYEGDALMYAAIFSDKEDYECQLDRLMSRTEQLFEIYQDKMNFVFQKTGCNSEIDADLIIMLNLIKDYQTSQDLTPISSQAETMNNKNEYAECKLW